MQAHTDCTNVSLHTHTLACKEHLGDEDLVGNYDSRRSGKQRRSARRVKAVLEQLCNHYNSLFKQASERCPLISCWKSRSITALITLESGRNRDVGGLVRDRGKGEMSGDMIGFVGVCASLDR